MIVYALRNFKSKKTRGMWTVAEQLVQQACAVSVI